MNSNPLHYQYTNPAMFDVLSGADEDSSLQVYEDMSVVCFGEDCRSHVQDGMKRTQYLLPYLMLPEGCQQDPQFNSLHTNGAPWMDTL